MPLPAAHGLLGASIVAALHPRTAHRGWAPLLLGAFLAVVADFDFLLVVFTGSDEWHRGFTHSILFAGLVCLSFFLVLGRRRCRPALAYGLAYSSHCLLDYATTTHGGVELGWFFSPERWKLGWLAISEQPMELPVSGVVHALFVETLLFAPLLLLTIFLRKYLSRN